MKTQTLGQCIYAYPDTLSKDQLKRIKKLIEAKNISRNIYEPVEKLLDMHLDKRDNTTSIRYLVDRNGFSQVQFLTMSNTEIMYLIPNYIAWYRIKQYKKVTNIVEKQYKSNKKKYAIA